MNIKVSDKVDFSKMKLGKGPAKWDSQRLTLGKYFTNKLSPPPSWCNWTKGKTSYGMMLNDSLGDCTIAGVGHAIQVWSMNVSEEVTIPDSVILQYYEKWDGYNPNNPSSDQGGIEVDVLNNWRKSGFSNHNIIAYADPVITDHVHIKIAISLFGGLYIGLILPVSAQTQKVWHVVKNDGGVWGGHCVFIVAYNDEELICITWGRLMRMTWAFWDKYVDEAHAIISKDWLNSNQVDPSGIDLALLEKDLQIIKD